MEFVAKRTDSWDAYCDTLSDIVEYLRCERDGEFERADGDGEEAPPPAPRVMRPADYDDGFDDDGLDD